MKYILIAGILCLSSVLFAQDHLIKLWTNGVPDQRGNDEIKSSQTYASGSYYNVQEPRLKCTCHLAAMLLVSQ